MGIVAELHNFLANELVYHLLVAAGLGALIGLEREFAGKDPSLRTFALISLGSCVFSLMSLESARDVPGADPGRIASYIVSGIGFLGAGAIFRSSRGVSGLTTAALMWVTAAIGMSVGFDQVRLAISATLIALLITLSLQGVHRLLSYTRRKRPLSEPSPTDIE